MQGFTLGQVSGGFFGTTNHIRDRRIYKSQVAYNQLQGSSKSDRHKQADNKKGAEAIYLCAYSVN